ncbi:sensor histidine kinase [Streptomyces melanogenes]|uniref:sensor histidine kinase n=1 Tax=Streptomyces melanogenes TaxID=67326 RepID=UPI0019A58E09|nr:two-component sensor histidine kinase [Streptomyces melanogenes]
MTETLSPKPPGSTPGNGVRSPEFLLAMDAFGGLRQDLFRDAFAYRPLPPMRTDGPLTRHLSDRLRRYAAWTPHAAVLFVAFCAAVITYTAGSQRGGPELLIWVASGLLTGVPVAMTLIRPVGAWWTMCATTVVMSVLGRGDGLGWPWAPGTFLAQLTVMVVVALRTRPRTAAWMWVLTLLLGTVMQFSGHRYGGSDAGTMAVTSAILLLIAVVVSIRREAEQKITVQQSVTAVERDKRTVLEERTTIARELHDVVAHHMSVVAIQAEAAPYRVEDPPPELTQAFATIRENAVAALTELRRVLGVVRAEDYEAPDAPQPTLADLDRLLANVRDAGLDVTKAVTGAVRELPQGVELSAYRIIQEALSNALRHAPGAAARVEVGYVLGGVGLRVVNGPPTGPAAASPGSGHGITGMRERVAMLGGEMTAGEVGEDGGYEVTVFIPVTAAATAGEA